MRPASAWPLLAAATLAACTTQQTGPATPAAVAPAVQHPARPLAAVARPVPPIAGLQATHGALEAFRRACPRLLRRIDQSGLTTAQDWKAPCADPERDPATFFARHFAPVRLGDGRGLATGYFEPEIAGLTHPAPGAAPVLARPPELVEIDLSRFGSGYTGTIRGVVQNGRVVPAPDRAAIEGGAFAGRNLELGWAADPVDLFFLHIQGSGRLRFPDGSSLRIGYAGQNGHSYVAIGRLLRQRGILEQAGMAEIKAWLRANPAEGAALMRENPSYIFFRRLPESTDGPIGALGVPLLAEANAAADPTSLPLGAPVWIETMVEGAPYNRLLVASDTGGAIRGANRFDIFFGPGEDAGRKAGALAAPLTATLLLPRPAVARLAR